MRLLIYFAEVAVVANVVVAIPFRSPFSCLSVNWTMLRGISPALDMHKQSEQKRKTGEDQHKERVIASWKRLPLQISGWFDAPHHQTII